jgi:hypothetical protein
VAQIVARRLAVRQFRSRLGTPEEALYREESNEGNKSGSLRVVYIIVYVCSINEKTNTKSGSVPTNLQKKDQPQVTGPQVK